MGTARAMNSVKGMQAADGPDSWQLEWHQDGVKTTSVSATPAPCGQQSAQVAAVHLAVAVQVGDGGHHGSDVIASVFAHDAKPTRSRTDACEINRRIGGLAEDDINGAVSATAAIAVATATGTATSTAATLTAGSALELMKYASQTVR